MIRIYWFYLFALIFSGFMAGIGAVVANEKAISDNEINRKKYQLLGSLIGIAVAVFINVIIYMSARDFLYNNNVLSDVYMDKQQSSPNEVLPPSPIQQRFLPLEERSRTLSDPEVEMLRNLARTLKNKN